MEILSGQIELIRNTLNANAIERKNDAALAGSWDDGGASKMLTEFDFWLDGVNFALTGNTTKYKNIINQHNRENDPEYQQYLELKKKFENKP